MPTPTFWMGEPGMVFHEQLTPLDAVAVIGLGLIGGSLARSLHDAGVRVVGWDTDADTRAAAVAAGITVADSLDAGIAGEPDLIVLAVPLAVMEHTIEAIAPLVGDKTVITDVGSIKSSVRTMFRSSTLSDRYVGSHPMAGTEKTGFRASSADLLQDTAWVVTLDSERGTPLHPALRVIELMTRVLGSRIYVMSDEQHDEAVALVSHLPHVFAAQLLNQTTESPLSGVALAIAAGSFRDGTRVAGTNPARTEAMIVGNREQVAPLVEQAANQLRGLAERLRTGQDMSAFFDSARPTLTDDSVSRECDETSRVDYGSLAASDIRSKLIGVSRDGMHIHAIDLVSTTIDYRR